MDREKVIKRASKLAEMAPRIGKTEREAADYIESKIEQEVKRQGYNVLYPKFETYKLVADGEEVPCLPGGLKSGRIETKNIVNSVHNEQEELNEPSISFNPYAKDISVTTFYQAPCLAIGPSDIPKILEAEKIEGKLEVDWKSEESYNLIVGNTEDPEQVILTHYDSLWGSFIDNSFSVSLLIGLLDKIDLEKTLVVFAGSEELSQETPYHCYGYRRFEAGYSSTLEKAEDILVVDSLGRGDEQKIIQKDQIVKKAIVFSKDDYQEKTRLAASSYEDVLDIYHSKHDTEKALTSYESAKTIMKDQIKTMN